MVTPKTDPGDYNVEPNADLILQAGQQITLKPGTHIKQGAKAHLKIFYNECSGSKSLTNTGNQSNETDYSEKEEPHYLSSEQRGENTITIYPNPTNGSFNVASLQDVPVESLQVYNLNGNLVKSRENISSARFEFESRLEQGTYLVIVRTRDACLLNKQGMVHRKKIVII